MAELEKQTRVLLIDDHEDMYTLISCGLEVDCTVDYAPDGFTAQQLVTANDYDLILCDINMPFMNGLMIIEEFKKKNIRIPFIFITGEINQDISKQAFQLGAHNIISKPFKLKTLRDKIKIAVSMSNKVNNDIPADQEVGYLYNLLKSHYYDFEKIMYNIQYYNIPLNLIALELEKKERSGKCLLDDPEYILNLVPNIAQS